MVGKIGGWRRRKKQGGGGEEELEPGQGYRSVRESHVKMQHRVILVSTRLSQVVRHGSYGKTLLEQN